MKAQLDLFPFPVSVRRSSRARRMAIHVEAMGQVELVLPKRASEALGIAFLAERQDWIIQILKKQESAVRVMPVTELKNGASLPFFGDTLLLRVSIESDRTRSFVEEKSGELIAHIPETSKLRLAVSRFYIAQSKQYFIGQSHEYGQIIGKNIPRVRVIDMKTQWGSCNHRTHTLTFNWRLALAPEHVARYVTAHEVAHIIHANHSARFWKAVAQLNPNYASSRAWLKQYGGSLVIK
ncbi:MAG: M48 family metallopeptidase [Candidatus Andersenbacteria bacterium]|nr:M48 family metallopeptidase [Candidatus Andersenbacteria bacterium]